MRLRGLLCAGVCLMLAGPAVVLGQEGGAASAQKAFTSAPIAPADSLDALLTLLQSEVVSAADAMPADKYDFAPPTTYGNYAGVRTFGQQVKHLAEANYEFFKGTGVPGAVDTKTIEALKTKDDIMKALKDSYAYAHAGIATITADNAFMSVQGPPQWKLTHASVATFALAHSMDHYGQMVEYLRMNGIVPPASRQQGNM
jgi:uncharacterized damage-inducible protein DinB